MSTFKSNLKKELNYIINFNFQNEAAVNTNKRDNFIYFKVLQYHYIYSFINICILVKNRDIFVQGYISILLAHNHSISWLKCNEF